MEARIIKIFVLSVIFTGMAWIGLRNYLPLSIQNNRTRRSSGSITKRNRILVCGRGKVPDRDGIYFGTDGITPQIPSKCGGAHRNARTVGMGLIANRNISCGGTVG